MADPVLCELIEYGNILEIGAFRFWSIPRVGEVVAVAIPGDDHDELFKVIKVMHSALESREMGDRVKLVVTRNIND